MLLSRFSTLHCTYNLVFPSQDSLLKHHFFRNSLKPENDGPAQFSLQPSLSYLTDSYICDKLSEQAQGRFLYAMHLQYSPKYSFPSFLLNSQCRKKLIISFHAINIIFPKNLPTQIINIYSSIVSRIRSMNIRE